MVSIPSCRLCRQPADDILLGDVLCPHIAEDGQQLIYLEFQLIGALPAVGGTRVFQRIGAQCAERDAFGAESFGQLLSLQSLSAALVVEVDCVGPSAHPLPVQYAP